MRWYWYVPVAIGWGALWYGVGCALALWLRGWRW